MADLQQSAVRMLDATTALGLQIRAAADEIEEARRLPMHLVREMQRAGIFRMAMPQAWVARSSTFLLRCA
jgi:alkylation response protein AidB-like acyl-CoA dehydrogenase